MSRNKLKTYAPKARRDFIKAVTDRAAFYGLTEENIEPVTEQGDVAIIGGKPFPIDVTKKRKRLEERIRREGFEQVMEAMAYTCFNRFVAIRFMEVHGYLDHGYRILSTTNNTNSTNKEIGRALPEIMGYAEHVDLPGVDKEKVVELKLAGNRDDELYRMLLIAQCNVLNKAMPFLFEWIGDVTELLLPENLLHSDSLIRKMINEIPEEEWEEVEIIGWLYQFYISEKKDQVIGKVVKTEDIPAVTQLFTPNWIVKYMVQNTLGRQWVASYPNSPLKQQMEYYIEPAEQTPEVEEQLAAITPSTLNPEELTLLDPACGSGHILVEAYDVFKAIYQERGYRAKDIPKLILAKNLYGLEIDDRAAQLAAFALMMKVRADDRRLFERGVKLNVMALVDSTGFDAEQLAQGMELANYGLRPHDLTALKRLFEHATTFGSLIQVPVGLAAKLPTLKQLSEAPSQDLFVSDALKRLAPLVQQAGLLAAQYDAVVANPPYLSANGMNATIKEYAKKNYSNTKSDTYSMFVERYVSSVRNCGSSAFVTPYTWMFLTTHRSFRSLLFSGKSITSLVKPSYTSFFESAIVPLVTFVVTNRIENLKGKYTGLGYLGRGDEQADRLRSAISGSKNYPMYESSYEDFLKIPGSPMAYWVSEGVRKCYQNTLLRNIADIQEGLKTGDNARFIRKWFEVNHAETNLVQGRDFKWYSHTKGGGFRRWYGNCEDLLLYSNGGAELSTFPKASLTGKRNYFKENITWGRITSGQISFRYTPDGSIPNMAGLTLYPQSESLVSLLGCLNSKCCDVFLSLTNPTLNFPPGTISVLPITPSLGRIDTSGISRIISLAKADWGSYETSWDFISLPLLNPDYRQLTLKATFQKLRTRWRDMTIEIQMLEEENNRTFIEAYGLQDELTPDVPISKITLTCNPHYRYGGNKSEEELEGLLLTDTIRELISYAIACMMGRYSLDQPGLIYAHSGNDQFWEIYHEKHKQPKSTQNKNHSSNSRYSPAPLNGVPSQGVQPGWSTFSPDQDGIIPITDTDWFSDDAANRFIEFISVAWDAEHLEENLTFLAGNLSPKKNESSRETIRRYLCDKFFKDHLQTYKKRPIYWLFSSGKLRAFQCLVYLHRYNEGTLSRMRTEYVIPLQGKISARIDQLTGDINASTSTAHRKKLERERDKLAKQQIELQTFDEKLRHYADQRISLDLDDGVKVNFGKFGDLLAEVKAITGKK